MQKMMEQSHIKVFKIIAEEEYASRDKASVCWRKSLFAESLVIVLNTLTPPDLPGPALARSVCFQQTQYFLRLEMNTQLEDLESLENQA